MEAETLQEKYTAALLPLDEPRVIAIRDGKFTYRFHFSRITQADWEKYFQGIYFTSRYEGKAQVTTLDLDTAGIELFESKLVKAEGYAGDFDTRPGWQKKIPPRHSAPVAWVLRWVQAADLPADRPFDPEVIEVSLDAVWSQAEPASDPVIYKGLLHRFTPPTVEHQRRYFRAKTSSRIVGGSRNGTTVYASTHKTLLELYDQLVISAEGYGISGRALNGADEVRREMDAYHKTQAVTQLFSGSAAESQTEAA